MESLAKKNQKISFLEIARVLGVSKRIPKSNIKEATKYQSREYKVLLSERNTSHPAVKKRQPLTSCKWGRSTLQRLTNQGRSSL